MRKTLNSNLRTLIHNLKEKYLIRAWQWRKGVNLDGLIGIQVAQGGPNHADHLLTTGRVKRHLKVADLDAEVSPETVKMTIDYIK